MEEGVDDSRREDFDEELDGIGEAAAGEEEAFVVSEAVAVNIRRYLLEQFLRVRGAEYKQLAGRVNSLGIVAGELLQKDGLNRWIRDDAEVTQAAEDGTNNKFVGFWEPELEFEEMGKAIGEVGDLIGKAKPPFREPVSWIFNAPAEEFTEFLVVHIDST
jgi:hypothetical protein